ncbi:MAG: hypothetical protein J3Q66DRAFT_392910 [Benniella sp.]|nr:MAG: hypothetical protein J3Q66DRAFT_392910 [Benniella sp.]
MPQSRSRGNLPSSVSDSEIVPDLKPLPQSYAPLACDDRTNAVPFDMSILTISHRRDHNTLKALIVGGGIAGLAIAAMMDLAGIEYQILEKSTGEEPDMGSVVFLGPPVLRLMEQMELLKDIESMSKKISGVTIVDSESRRIGRIPNVDKERYGYAYIIITRAAFREILLERVPKGSLHRGKVVVETLQNPNGVSCKCSDGSTYYGDIIVGADGACSPTRERMFAQMSETGKLPDADLEPSVYEYVGIAGISQPLDSTLYPTVAEETSELQVVCAKDQPCSFWYYPIPGNRMAWGINGQLQTPKHRQHIYSHSNGSGSTARRDPSTKRPHLRHSSSFSSSTSSPPPTVRTQKIHDDWWETAPDFEEDFQELLDMRCAVGPGSARDFLRYTSREKISRLDLKERLYKTWHYGRIVLVGDACHQHLVMGGQGASQALLDGVCLVNLLYDMEYNSPHEINKAFKKYHTRRMANVKSSMEDTGTLEKIYHSTGFLAGVMRRIVFNTAWTFNVMNDKTNNNRPQLSFLPFVEDRAPCKAFKQKVSERLLRSQQLQFATD